MAAEYWRWLGIEPPQEEEKNFVSWNSFAKASPRLVEKIQNDSDDDPIISCRAKAWTPEEEPELAEYLKQNEKPLALVIEATLRPKYFNPLVPRRTEETPSSLLNSLVSNVQKCRELACALTCRAMLRNGQGKTDEAWQDLVACHRLGRLVARGGTLIELLVGLAIQQVASDADIGYLCRTPMTSQQITERWAELQGLSPMPLLVDKVNLGERYTALQFILLMAEQGTEALSWDKPQSKNPNRIHWFRRRVNGDSALRNINLWYDRLVEILTIEIRSTRTHELERFEHEVFLVRQRIGKTYLVAQYFLGPDERGEWIGNIIIGLLLPSIDRMQGAVDRSQQSLTNLHLAFALAAYHADHGRYPDKLDDLAPKYPPSLPLDLFSEKPLIYRLEGAGYLLYSVGPNGKDDEGRGNDDTPKGDDLAIRMPPRKPQQAK
jgi:hypothetical protein